MSKNARAKQDGAEYLKDLFAICRKSSKKSRDGEYYSTETIRQYAMKLLILWRVLHGNEIYKPEHGWLWLLDSDHILEKLNKTAYVSKKDYVCPALTLLRHFRSTDHPDKDLITDDILDKYSEFVTKDTTLYRKQRYQNIAKPARVLQALSLDQARTLIDSYNVGEGLRRELFMKLLVQFYFEGELVPRNDLHILKFITPPPDDAAHPYRLSREWNYLVVDETGLASTIIMNNYKTHLTYGQQAFGIPAKLAETIQEYWREYTKSSGDFVFVTTKGAPYTKMNMTNAIKSSTYAVLGKCVCIDVMRSINMCHYYNSGPHSINEDLEKARQFLHSKLIQKEYFMLNFPNNTPNPDLDVEDETELELVPLPPPILIESDVMRLEYIHPPTTPKTPEPQEPPVTPVTPPTPSPETLSGRPLPNPKIAVSIVRRPIVKRPVSKGKTLVCQIQVEDTDSGSETDATEREPESEVYTRAHRPEPDSDIDSDCGSGNGWGLDD